MKCSKCKATIQEEASFCPSCGNRLSGTTPNSIETTDSDAFVRKVGIAIGVVVFGVIVALFVSISIAIQPGSSSPETPVTIETESTEPESIESVGQANAREKAEQYLQFSAFSKSGLINQLLYEGFSKADSTYGVEALVVDWNEQAVKKGEEYLRYSAFSASGLMNQLVYEGFTKEQAAYGALMNGFKP
jgi:hypothetical protein